MTDDTEQPESLVLCVNCGSSSLKFGLYGGRGEVDPKIVGAVEGIGTGSSRLWLREACDSPTRPSEESSSTLSDHRAAIRAMIDAFEHRAFPTPVAVGHRVVHGGTDRDGPARIDEPLITELRGRIPLAPLHLPVELEAIDAVSSWIPGVAQVACFDTAFHRHMPRVAQELPLPKAIREEGVLRFGFHGLSCESIVETLAGALLPRTVIAHLGNGASVTALRHGRSVETSMGFTPIGGVVMGTRSGDLDPGILLYLLSQPEWDAARLARLVTQESGLLGISGVSSDMRTLLALRDSEPGASDAIETFCYRVRKEIGALAAVLGGLDLLVFTGGIAEAAPPLCREICGGLEHLGIALDEERDGARLSADGARCAVRILPTHENRVIARQVRRLLRLDADRGIH